MENSNFLEEKIVFKRSTHGNELTRYKKLVTFARDHSA